MSSSTPNVAAGAVDRPEARDPAAAPAVEAGPFVLNLCSSTTPMALAQADLEELKRFTFFVSRRFEEGRERFRLHMGYFSTLAEAEEWLSVVREIYPGAWAGEAPGKKLRAKAAAAAAAQAQHAVGPQPRSALPNLPPSIPAAALVPPTAAPSPIPAPRAAAAAAPVRSAPILTPNPPAAPVARPVEASSGAPAAPSAVPFDVTSISVPTVHAASPAAPAPVAAPPVVSPPVVTPVAKPPAARVQALPPSVTKAAPVAQGVAPAAKNIPTVSAALTSARAQGAVGQVRVAAAAAMPPKAVGVVVSAKTPLRTSTTPAARSPVKATTPPVSSAKSRTGVASKASPKGTAFADSNVREVLAALDDTSETGQTRMMPAPQIPRAEAEDEGALTDTQVLRYLETRRSDEEGRPGEDAPDASISLLKPDDTGTRRALKEAVTHNAPVSFAVQLQWAVQPVELDKVPPLAIFSAYTLYTVEGSREGRKWYGLRLGFFSDAISAKQVAYYVRSEFASVAVVPVSPQEKARATDADKKTNASLAFPRKTRQGQVDEFKLIDSDDVKDANPGQRPAAGKPAAVPTAAAPAGGGRPAQAGAGKKGVGKGAGRVGARERRGAQTLEETLEILGAGELEIDSGSGESVSDTGVRHLRVEVQKNTPFSRLLERLSERTKKT